VVYIEFLQNGYNASSRRSDDTTTMTGGIASESTGSTDIFRSLSDESTTEAIETPKQQLSHHPDLHPINVQLVLPPDPEPPSIDLPESQPSQLFYADVLNIVVAPYDHDESTHVPTDTTTRNGGFARLFLRRRRNDLEIKFSASTTLPLPTTSRFLSHESSLLHSTTATTKLVALSIAETKLPFNFHFMTLNETFLGYAKEELGSDHLSMLTVQLNPIELQKCLSSSSTSSVNVSNDFSCFWDSIETLNASLSAVAAHSTNATQTNASVIGKPLGTISIPRNLHEYTGFALVNVLHRFQSCDDADYILDSIIEKGTSVLSNKGNFVAFRGPSFDNGTMLRDAGFYRSYEHTAVPICRFTSIMLWNAFEKYLTLQQQRILSTHADQKLDVKDNSNPRIMMNESSSLLDDNLSDKITLQSKLNRRWLVAYIIVQYQPIESSYDPILVPKSTPHFPLHLNIESPWHYNRHQHPPKNNIRGFDHIYQKICGAAISIPLQLDLDTDNWSATNASIIHSALAMDDCFHSRIWDHYKGSIVSCRYAVLDSTQDANSTIHSDDNSLRCRHILQRTIQDVLVEMKKT
jgi:hypothetical protein